MGTGGIHRSISASLSRPALAFASALLLALAACAELPQQPAISAEDLAWVAGGAGGASEQVAVEDPPALLRVNEEMRRFAQDSTRGKFGVTGKTNALMHALAAQDGLALQYDVEATLSAEQSFQQRRANCLSYTMLFVALAREVGIPAKFNEVEIPPIWDMGDEHTSLLYMHVNARVDSAPPFFQIIDVSGDEYDPSFQQHLISDAEALAQFYNNRAVALRLQRRYSDALRYQLRALDLAPEAAYLWTNLASLYLAEDNLRAARVAVTKALTLDSSCMLSYDTAAQTYEQLGEHRLARYFHQRAEYFLDQNPYYHYQLALADLDESDLHHAYNEMHRAILLYPKDPRFFFAMAVVLDRLGETLLASQSMQAAMELTPDLAQQARYRSKFARLSKQG